MTTLLVVEHDPRLAELMGRALIEEGYAVRLAGSAEQCLELAARTPYEGLVIDVMLPGMDGLEACRRLRRGGFRAPVVLIGARDSLSDADLRSADVDRCLPKPFSMAQLLAMVECTTRVPSVGAAWPDGAAGADGVIASIGPGSSQLAAEALRRLTDRPTEVVGGLVAGVALAVVQPWRIGVHRGSSGIVALALAGTAHNLEGTPPERLASELSRGVAERWGASGFDGLGDALERSAADLTGDFFVIAAGAEALRVAVLASGMSPVLLRCESSAMVASTTLALPPDAPIEWLALRERTATPVEMSPPGRADKSFLRLRMPPAWPPRAFRPAGHHAA
jgi:CheY-like chemotaxis protein